MKPSEWLTDSNKFWAELPKMNEKPKIIVANGTRDAIVFFRLKTSRQTKRMATTVIDKRTPSSFATIESTSWRVAAVSN